MTKRDDVNAMSWPKLCDALLDCQDVARLSRWLRDTMAAGGPPYRAMRVHGRLSAVRRHHELKAIRAACDGQKRGMRLLGRPPKKREAA
jgi:hypothetical protein